MLSESEVLSLVRGRHPDPFSVLGLHPDSEGALWVRAFLPGAAKVALQERGGGSPVVRLDERHADGLWEACVPRRRDTFDYRLQVTWHNGDEGVYADAYSFGLVLPGEELDQFSRGEHPRPWELLGAHPMALGGVDGVRFGVWAPNAAHLGVIGDFNAWDARRHPMRLRHSSGVWELFLPHATVGDLYKFALAGADGRRLPDKADPYARSAQRSPDTASRVAPPARPASLPSGRADANDRGAPISIYEVHLGSWQRHPDGRFHSWEELALNLPAYAADMGYTHIEFMPVSEHPFDGSWGYQTLGLYAPTARFGPPEGFAHLVDACRARGIGVILDWVPAHFPSDPHGLAQFDGTALYEHQDPREGMHRDWQTLIYNFGRSEVREFLVGSARYWIECLGVDGLRVDAVASMLYRDYSRGPGEWIPNIHGGRENLEAIEFLKRANQAVDALGCGAMTLAEESTAFPGVTAPVDSGGLGFHYKWNMGWMHDTLKYMHEDPVHRRWHHDKMTFGLIYAFNENFVLPLSHDEVVHGKGSILDRMPGDDWQRFANVRAYYGFMWGHPGKKLLFMGQDFAQPRDWNHDTELPWHLLQDPRHAGVQRLVRDLNGLYRRETALHRLDCDGRGFEWIESHDGDQSIFAWVRRDEAGREAIVVCNFTPVPRHGFRLGVPAGAAAWREALNTDSAYYGGSNLGNGGHALPVDEAPAHGRAQSVVVTLPPLATLFLLPA